MKYHLTVADSGTLILATHTGESFKSLKIIQLHVGDHSYNYVYVALNVVIVIFLVAILLLVCRKVRELKGSRFRPGEW